MSLVVAASEIAMRALPTIGMAVVAATARSGLPSVSAPPTLRGSVEALIGACREAKEGKVFIGASSVLKFYPTRQEAEMNLVRHQTASILGYGPEMVSRDVGVMPLASGERYYLVFERLEPFAGEPTAEQRADLRAKVALMHKEGRHTHGDIHAGNLLVKPNGEIVFNDFDFGP